MDELLKYLPLLNVLAVPGVLIIWRAAVIVEKLHAEMRESKEDRRKLWDTVRPMEREMLKRGMLDAS